MLEAIVVLFSVIGCFATWYALYQMKENDFIADLHTNPHIRIVGTAVTVIISAIALDFGWTIYAVLCLVSAPIDFAVKRAILAR